MILMKELNNCMFNYINPWDEILSSIAWAECASYHSMLLGATLAQLVVFGREMISNSKTIYDWTTVTAHKQKQTT
jgi:hypothetical protein